MNRGRAVMFLLLELIVFLFPARHLEWCFAKLGKLFTWWLDVKVSDLKLTLNLNIFSNKLEAMSAVSSHWTVASKEEWKLQLSYYPKHFLPVSAKVQRAWSGCEVCNMMVTTDQSGSHFRVAERDASWPQLQYHLSPGPLWLMTLNCYCNVC